LTNFSLEFGKGAISKGEVEERIGLGISGEEKRRRL